MRYFLAKQKYLKSGKYGIEEGMIEDKVELSDITKYKRDMIFSISEFIVQKRNISNFQQNDGDDVEVALIKNQVLEMADKCD